MATSELNKVSSFCSSTRSSSSSQQYLSTPSESTTSKTHAKSKSKSKSKSKTPFTVSSLSRKATHGSEPSRRSSNSPSSTSTHTHPHDHHSSASSSTSSNSTSNPNQHEYHTQYSDEKIMIKRYINEPRDYRSWAVDEYDIMQVQARDERWDELERDVDAVDEGWGY